MVELAEVLLSFPPDNLTNSKQYHDSIQAFRTNLSSISTSKLVGLGKNGEDVLDMLDPFVNSTSYLAVLNARLEAGAQSISGPYDPVAISFKDSLVPRIFHFLTTFDPIQMRYSGGVFRRLVESIMLSANKSKQPQLAVVPLRTAMLRLDPTTGTFTTLHLYFLQLCLRTRDLLAALPILANPIHSYPSKSPIQISGSYPCEANSKSNEYITLNSGLTGEITSAFAHEYYLLGAIIYIGLRKWSEALLFLELVLVSPNAGVANGLMLEAYKKWLLVGCILYGKSADTPKGANPATMRVLKTAARPYESLVDDFANNLQTKLRAEIDVGMKIWQEEGNMGLVEQLGLRAPWFFVKSVQATYSAVPLIKMAGWLDMTPDATYTLLEEFISTGELKNAAIRIDGPEPVLHFQISGTKPEELYPQLSAQADRTNLLAAYIKTADERLTLSSGYLEELRKKSRFKEESGGGRGENWTMGGMEGDQPTPEPVEDEDLMETN